MAFVFRAQRSLSPQVTATTNAGPGSYQVLPRASASEGYAPFSSQAKRKSVVAPQVRAELKPNPGVGDYDLCLSSEEGRILLAVQSHKLKVLNVPKEQAVFCSAIPRFQGKGQITPGPGAYQAKQASISKRIQDKLKKQEQQMQRIYANNQQQQMNQQIKGTSPSIPVFSSQLGDWERPQKINRKKGGEDNRVGKRVSGVPWCKIKEKRIVFDSKEKAKQVGPGSYEITKPMGQDTDQGKTRPKPRAKKDIKQTIASRDRRVLMSNQLQGIQQRIILLERLEPGPGFYFNQQSYYSIKAKIVPVQHQCFGSTVERFKAPPGIKVGPGQYDVTKDSDQIRPTTGNNRSQSKGFNMTGPRFSTPPPQTNPTYYATNSYSFAQQLKKKVLAKANSKAAFGSFKIRFANEKSIITPGPCDYETQIKIKTQAKKQSLRKPLAKRPATCKPTQASLLTANNFTDINPTNSNQRPQPRYKSKSIPKRAPFNSSNQRFGKARQLQINRQGETEPSQQQVKQRAGISTGYSKPMTGNSTLQFGSKQLRFRKDYFLQVKSDGPGPADYDTQGLYRKSYNVLFN